MKKILIPTDFSKNSYQTIDYITELFTNENCEFYFLNSYYNILSGLNAIEMLHTDNDWFDKPKQDSIEQLGKLIERFTTKSKNSKHEFYAISEHMNLVDSLKKNIEDIHIDLMVLTGKAAHSKGKNIDNILEHIRTSPILVVPPHASVGDGLHLTIASDFKQQVNIDDLEKFCKILANTKIKLGVLVLEKQNSLSKEACNHLETVIASLEKFSEEPVELEYIKHSFRLKDYAAKHLGDIMCIVDKKPGLFRKLGLNKSKATATLRKLNANTVLTVHQ